MQTPAAPPAPATSTTEPDHVRLAGGCPARHAETVTAPHPTWEAWFRAGLETLGTGCLLILLGDRGSGKTQLATELVRESRACHRKARYTTAIDFFLSLREAYRSAPDAPSEREVLKQFIETDLLVIDEIHERGGSDWEDRMLRYVIDQRYGARRDTVVIGNLKRDALFAALGKSVESRFCEIGTFVECVGVNWRAKP